MFVSIIVPVYNNEKTINTCLNALVSQKSKHTYEIIIIDDGSKDNTKKEISKIKSQKLKYFYQTNSGPAKARNAGAKKAKGKIILFIDSDCIAKENWLEEMLSPFENKKVVAVQGAYKTKQKELIARFVQVEIEHRYEKMKQTEELDWVGSYSAAYNKKVFDSLGGFDESFPIASGEDPEFSFRIAKHGKIIFNAEAIVHHSHPSGLEKYLKTKFFRAYFRPKMYSKHKGKMLKDSYTPQSLKLQILCFYLVILSLLIGIFVPLAFLSTSFFVIVHIALGLNFFIFAFKKDDEVAILSPVILFLRSIVFGAGLIWGKLRG